MKEIELQRSGTLQEDMYWIDAVDLKIVAKELNQMEASKIVYSDSTKRKIYKKDNLITIHTHPYSFPPSIEDLNSNHANKYAMGIVCCHDGKVFVYKSDLYIIPAYYKKEVEELIKHGYNEFEAQMNVLKRMEERFAIKVTEVCL